MPLSPNQAQILLETDALNLAQKVKNQKPLTATERRSLEAIANSGGDSKTSIKTFVGNQIELANALGVTHRSIQNWLKMKGNPGKQADGRYHVQSWREWARVNGRKCDDNSQDKSALQARNILLQNERLELANTEKRNLLIPRALAKQIFTQLVTAVKSRCFSGIPRIVTLARMAKDTVEASEELRKEFNDIWEQMTHGEWFKEAPIAQDTSEPPAKRVEVLERAAVNGPVTGTDRPDH